MARRDYNKGVSEAPVIAPPPATAPPCAAHPDQSAAWYCPACRRGLCRDCINSYTTGDSVFAACRTCGSRCDRVGGEPWRPENDRSSFAWRLPRALVAPLRNRGWISIIAGGFLLAVVAVISSINLFGYIFMMLIFGYIAAFAMKTVEEAAAGALGVSDWPALDDFWGDIVVPLLELGGTTAVVFAPAILYGGFSGDGGGAVHITLLVIAFAYYPMALLAVVMYGTLNALSPRLVLPAIRDTLGSYALLCLLIAAAEAGRIWLNTLVDRSVAWTMIGGVAWMYLDLMEAWLLGAFYHANRHRIGWFERERHEQDD